jgi:hypothetical protein
MAWLAGAVLGIFAGVLLVSWLPLLLKVGLIAVLALALDLPRTRSSRGLQAGFLFSAGVIAFIVLMMSEVLTGRLAALIVAVIGLGFWRTLEFVDRRHWA